MNKTRNSNIEIRNRSKNGAILFLAVGAIAVLSILALGATSGVLQQLKLAQYVNDSNTSSHIAPSVVDLMKVLLANDETPQAIILYDLRDRELPLGDKTIFIHPVDEQARINADLAPKEILARLPGLSGQTQLIDAVFAANIRVKEELLLLDGMTPEIYEQLKDMVTSFGLGLVNINTATPEIFAAQGMDEDLIKKIQEFRAGEDGTEGTEDDKYFLNTAEIIPQLTSYGLNPVQQQVIANLVANMQLGTTSDYICFNITVKQGKRDIRFFKLVANMQKGAIVSWQEL